MADIFLTNSLSKKKEKFVPISPPTVGIYTCGPTVYDYLSIGNFRTFVVSDTLRRVLEYNNYQVKAVMNVTDVGHLIGDGDLGEDKLIKAAKREKKTAWDIARFYTKAFIKDMEKLNIKRPDLMPRATDHIKEQIELVKTLEEKGFTYRTSDGVYFDTAAYEKKTGKRYGVLSTLDKIKAGARIEQNPEKKNPRDFALWKFSKKPGERQMEWKSPWGVGFPGWHIECSAMSMKYLGESFDVHVGGEDLRSTHHPNEIAQSEAATGKPFVRYWIHVTFLLVDGQRMGKSLGNIYTVSDVEKKNFEPLSLRYLYLTAHYRDPLNFTWTSLASAQRALEKLRSQVLAAKEQKSRTALSPEKQLKLDDYRKRFLAAVNDDLNTPQALAILWQMIKSNLPSEDKYDLALSFDEVLGLKLAESAAIEQPLPAEVKKLVEQRERLRSEGKFEQADQIRKRIFEKGYLLEDTPEGPRLKPAK